MIIYLASYTFLSLKFFLMEQSEKSPKDNFKNALCYIPLVAVLLFFIEENKTPDLGRNIKYWMYLFGLYVVISTLMMFTIILAPFVIILNLIYIWISIYYWYKVYNWAEIRIEFIDKLDDKINKKN